MEHALEVYDRERLIFHSDKDWLHPLFEFEQFLKNASIDREALLVKDKIIGRAAGLILCYLGIKHVFTETLSKHGKAVLDHFSIDYAYERLVPEIGCKTEQLLQDEWDPARAYQIIKERIKAQTAQTATS